MKARPFPRYIYGIFNEVGQCLYVGQTRDIKARTGSHRKRFGFGVSLRELEKTDSASNAAQLETKWIAKFKRDNHPILNRQLRGSKATGDYDTRQIFPRIERCDTGELFESPQHVAICFGLHPGTAKNRFTRYLEPDGHTWILIGNRSVRFRLIDDLPCQPIGPRKPEFTG